jgi:hypothetical protein
LVEVRTDPSGVPIPTIFISFRGPPGPAPPVAEIVQCGEPPRKTNRITNLRRVMPTCCLSH